MFLNMRAMHGFFSQKLLFWGHERDSEVIDRSIVTGGV